MPMIRKNACRQGPGDRNVQTGAALIVALVVLAAVTIIGVSNMQSSNFEMKMTASAIERSKTFAIVDNALKMIEDNMESGGLFSRNDLYTDACSGSKCFVDTCANGLCFQGSFDTSMSDAACKVAPVTSGVDRVVFWEGGVWDDAAKYKQEDVGDASVKYIVEFLCFVDDGTGGLYGTIGSPPPLVRGYPLFRITARYDGNNGRSPVMLQSTYSLQI